MSDLLIDPDCKAGKCGSCIGGPCEHYCHSFAEISDRLKASDWAGMTGKEAAALIDRVAELEGRDFRQATEIARLQARIDDLTGQVAGRDATIQRVRAHAAELRRCGVNGYARMVETCLDGDPADDGSQTDG